MPDQSRQLIAMSDWGVIGEILFTPYGIVQLRSGRPGGLREESANCRVAHSVRKNCEEQKREQSVQSGLIDTVWYSILLLSWLTVIIIYQLYQLIHNCQIIVNCLSRGVTFSWVDFAARRKPPIASHGWTANNFILSSVSSDSIGLDLQGIFWPYQKWDTFWADRASVLSFFF